MDRLWYFVDDHFDLLVGVVAAVIIALSLGFLAWYMRPISGEVQAREFAAAHYETRHRENCVTVVTGKNSSVRSCTYVPYQVWVNDRWSIKVCNEERCKWVDIDQTRYDDTQIGNHFSEQ